MRSISIVALVIGSMIGLHAVGFFVVAASFLIPPSPVPYFQNPIILIGLSLIFVATGFVTAHNAKKRLILHGALSTSLIVFIVLFFLLALPMGPSIAAFNMRDIMMIAAIMALGALGGWVVRIKS